MQNARTYATGTNVHIRPSAGRMHPHLKLSERRQSLPTTEKGLTDYIGRLLLGVQEPLQPDFMKSAINEDIEHFMNVEDFLSSDDDESCAFTQLTREEQLACDMATD